MGDGEWEMSEKDSSSSRGLGDEVIDRRLSESLVRVPWPLGGSSCLLSPLGASSHQVGWPSPFLVCTICGVSF